MNHDLKEYIIIIMNSTNRESQAYHSVIVIASDQAHHSNIVRSSTATLVVYVTGILLQYLFFVK